MRRTLLAAAGLVFLTGCSAHLPGQQPRIAPFAPWEAVFGEGPKVQLVPLLTGELEVAGDFLLDHESPSLRRRREGKEFVPVLAYLVRHPTRGDLLIDTGFDRTFAKRSHGNFGGLAFLAGFARQRPGHDTVSLLRTLGVDPAGLQMVVFSHLHPDHTAGLPDLPRHLPLVAGEGALASYGAPWYAPADHLAGFETIEMLALPEDGSAIDLFGDGSLLALPTPGHAAGNLSFLVRAEGGPVLLTCDASHTRQGFDEGVAPGGVEDRKLAQASLEALRAFVKRHPNVRVKAGHEASDWDLARGIQDPL